MKKEEQKTENRTGTSNGKGKMKQSTAIKLLSSLSALALVLVFCMLLFNMLTSNKYDEVSAAGEDTINYAQTFVDASAYLTQEVRSYVATGDTAHYDNYWQEVKTDKNREKSIEAMRKIGITEREDQLITEIQDLSNGLVPVEDRAMKETKDGVSTSAIAMVYSRDYEKTTAEIHKLEDELVASITERTAEEQEKLGNYIDTTFYLTFSSLAIVVAIQIAVIFYALRNIMAPLLHIKENMLQMSKGNLNVKLDVEEDDTEIGELAKAINSTKRQTALIIDDIDYVMSELAEGNFTVTLNNTQHYVGSYAPILASMRKLKMEQSETLMQIDTAAEQVALGSGQVSDGAQALAQGATEQASAVEELSATINDISNNARSNAKNSALALEHSKKASAYVSESADNIREMVAAMGAISQSSQEIGKIIGTIEQIAFQTNILALNAAVEAARAGVAGKGFAVVADEVRNLASKSDEAAKATKELISSSIDSVKHGEDIVNHVAEALESTIQASQQAEQDIAHITSAITEETDSISQVAEGIDQISSVVQTNSATSEQSAAASEELSSQAQVMKDLVSRFKLVQG